MRFMWWRGGHCTPVIFFFFFFVVLCLECCLECLFFLFRFLSSLFLFLSSTVVELSSWGITHRRRRSTILTHTYDPRVSDPYLRYTPVAGIWLWFQSPLSSILLGQSDRTYVYQKTRTFHHVDNFPLLPRARSPHISVLGCRQKPTVCPTGGACQHLLWEGVIVNHDNIGSVECNLGSICSHWWAFGFYDSMRYIDMICRQTPIRHFGFHYLLSSGTRKQCSNEIGKQEEGFSRLVTGTIYSSERSRLCASSQKPPVFVRWQSWSPLDGMTEGCRM